MIYILQKYPHLDNGHFWTFDGYIRRALRESNFPYLYLNPEATRASSEDGTPVEQKFEYFDIPNKNYMELAILKIRSHIEENSIKQITIFLTWLPQFTLDEFQKINELNEIAEIAYVGVSILTSSQIRGKTGEEYHYEFEKEFGSKKNRILWVSDFEDSNQNRASFVREIPDYAENKVKPAELPKYHIGFFGLQTPYRGIFEILMIALFNPRLRIHIKGAGFTPHRVFRPWKRKFFRYQTWRTNPVWAILFSATSLLFSLLRFLPNVEFSSQPFATDLDLDYGISQCQIIFYCPKLPHGSGLTNKSLAAGVPVLWHGWEGQAFRALVREYPQGFFDYVDLFIPNRITKKSVGMINEEGRQEKMWKIFSEEIYRVGDLFHDEESD
jgi:hypothetical protein